MFKVSYHVSIVTADLEHVFTHWVKVFKKLYQNEGHDATTSSIPSLQNALISSNRYFLRSTDKPFGMIISGNLPTGGEDSRFLKRFTVTGFEFTFSLHQVRFCQLKNDDSF